MNANISLLQHSAISADNLILYIHLYIYIRPQLKLPQLRSIAGRAFQRLVVIKRIFNVYILASFYYIIYRDECLFQNIHTYVCILMGYNTKTRIKMYSRTRASNSARVLSAKPTISPRCIIII